MPPDVRRFRNGRCRNSSAACNAAPVVGPGESVPAGVKAVKRGGGAASPAQSNDADSWVIEAAAISSCWNDTSEPRNLCATATKVFLCFGRRADSSSEEYRATQHPSSKVNGRRAQRRFIHRKETDRVARRRGRCRHQSVQLFKRLLPAGFSTDASGDHQMFLQRQTAIPRMALSSKNTDKRGDFADPQTGSASSVSYEPADCGVKLPKSMPQAQAGSRIMRRAVPENDREIDGANDGSRHGHHAWQTIKMQSGFGAQTPKEGDAQDVLNTKRPRILCRYAACLPERFIRFSVLLVCFVDKGAVLRRA